MNILLVTAWPSKQRLHIGLCVLMAAILCASGTDDRYDETDDVDHKDFKHLWDILRLSRINNPLRKELVQLPFLSRLSDMELDDDDTGLEDGEEITELESLSNKDREKRFGVAGLDNLDMMTKALDKQRQRARLPLSVSNMNFSRMRQLMSQAGRRK